MENRGSKEETLYYMIEGWHGELADTDLYFHAAYRQEHPVQKGCLLYTSSGSIRRALSGMSML